MRKKLYARVYTGLLLCLTLFLLLIPTVRLVLLPLFYGLILAFFVQPVRNLLVKLGLPLGTSGLLALLSAGFLVLSFFYFWLVPIANGASSFLSSMPSYFVAMENRLGLTRIFHALGIGEKMTQLRSELFLELFSVARLDFALHNLLKWLYLLVMSPVFAYFILRDKQTFYRQAKYLIPSQYQGRADRIYIEMMTGIKTYFYGYLFIAVLCGLLSIPAFLALGLAQWQFYSAAMALFSIIPFLGPFIGGIPAILACAPMGGKLWICLGLILVIQQIAGSVLTPKTVGNSLNIHPVFAMMIMFLGYALLGLFGLMFAVPIFVVVKVIVKNLFISATVK